MALDIQYKGHHVAWQRVDFIVDGCVIVEVKATERLSPAAGQQVLSYLAATPFEVGLILHFGPRPRYHRLIHSNKRAGAMAIIGSERLEKPR